MVKKWEKQQKPYYLYGNKISPIFQPILPKSYRKLANFVFIFILIYKIIYLYLG